MSVSSEKRFRKGEKVYGTKSGNEYTVVCYRDPMVSHGVFASDSGMDYYHVTDATGRGWNIKAGQLSRRKGE